MLDEVEDSSVAGTEGGGRAPGARPYVGIHFECCGVYARIYRPPEQPFYSGRCPKCGRTVRLRVGKEGTSARIFRAS